MQIRHEPEGLRLLRLALVAFLVLTLLTLSTSCKRKSAQEAANANNANAADETLMTPPFSTREPERYQWTRVITSIVAGDTSTSESFIARDGDKRREDYEILRGVRLTILRLPEGSYRLYPSKKIYAEMGGGGGATQNVQPQVSPDFSADKLVNASRTGARYEKLGTEDVGGRTTTKYRVTTRGAGGETAETIVWVDESLGMPIKSEMTSKNAAGAESKNIVEYKDIKLDVDASLFALPKDYKKVTEEEIKRETLSNLPGIIGVDNDENKGGGKKR